MTGFISLLSGGWAKIGLGIAAAVTFLATIATAFSAARESGRQSQQLADAQQQERDRAKADETRAGVDALGDDAAVRELHRRYDRQP